MKVRIPALLMAVVLCGGLAATLPPPTAAAGPSGGRSIPVHALGTSVVRDLPAATHTASANHRSPLLRSGATHPGATGSVKPALGTSPTATGTTAPKMSTALANPPFSVQQSFAGLTDGDNHAGAEPPDPWVAVGPTAVVQSVNSIVRITDRAGVVKGDYAADTFFGIPSTQYFTDPRIVYDAAHGRWVGVQSAWDCTDGYVYLAVSATSDPLGAWQQWYFTYAGYMADYPGLGISSDKIAISANEFPIDPSAPACVGSPFDVGSVLVADWASILGTTSFTDTYFYDPGYFAWRPAVNLTSDAGLYLVAERVSDGHVVYAKITGDNANSNPGGTDPTPVTFVGPTDMSSMTAFAPPPAPNQPGSPSTIADAVDERPTDAVWANGTLWFVNTYPATPAGDTLVRDTVHVGQITTRTATPTKGQDFVIGYAGYDTYMGGIGLAADGTAYIVYTTSSSTSPASTLASMQKTTDLANTVSEPVLVAAGAGTYNGTRWGDYVGVARDPLFPNAVWAADEYPDASGDWATSVTQLAVDVTPPVGTVSINAGAATTRTSAVTLSVPATDNLDPNGVKDVWVSNSATMAGMSIVPYAATIPWTLAAGDGTRSVYVRWRDNYGNVSAIKSDSILVDSTPPVVAAPAFGPLVGGTVTSGAVPIGVTWSGYDTGSGLVSYELARSVDAGKNWTSLSSSLVSVPYRTTTQPSGTLAYRVRAVDKAGNLSAWATGPVTNPRLLQESALSYAGTWGIQSATAYSGGTARYSWTAGSAATYSFTGRSVGLVMTKAVTRGAVKIYVDGYATPVTVDCYAVTTAYQSIVWQQTWPTTGAHTVKIVVVGTAGRPRVDLDAVIPIYTDTVAPGAPGAPVTVLRAGVASSTASLPVTVSWAAAADNSGGSGVGSYNVSTTTDGVTWSAPVTVSSTSYATTIRPSGTIRFRVQAVDRAGNPGGWVQGAVVTPVLAQTNWGLTWAGSWGTASSTAFSAGSSRYSASAGASATYRFTGRSIALVMTRASTRGSIRIYVDGSTSYTTVSCYAAATTYQVQMWTKTWSTSGTHTVKVVVVGTSGHPRIDYDAISLLK